MKKTWIWLAVMIGILSWAIYELIVRYWPKQVVPSNATASNLFVDTPIPVAPVQPTIITVPVAVNQKEDYMTNDMQVAINGQSQPLVRPTGATIAKIQVIEGDIQYEFGAITTNSKKANYGDSFELASAKEIDLFQFRSIDVTGAVSTEEARIFIHFYKLI
jgi:hypothetical protein